MASSTVLNEYICGMQVAIAYLYETDFALTDEQIYTNWLSACARGYGAKSLRLDIAFMNDDALFALNIKYLKHDTFTDIITFDDSVGNDIRANIAISIDRVLANAKAFSQAFETELLRVMSHGLLHCMQFNDKTEADKKKMRAAEEACIKLFHVEHKMINHVS